MNVIKLKPSFTIWNPVFKSGKEVRATQKVELAAFNRQKAALLAHLRKAHERGPKSAPLDEDNSWRRLIRLAQWYFSRNEMKKQTMAADRRVKRLCKLATALDHTRAMIDEAMQDDVGRDLFGAFCAENKVTHTAESSVMTRLIGEFPKLIASLTTLAASARRAAHDAHKGRGRPKDTAALPPDYIIALADLYRRTTGAKPGAGPGPFARFVCEFLDAVTLSDHVSATVIDAIKNAKAQAQIYQAAGRAVPSPFV